ncbi:MAG: hypothetical protein QOF30_1397 [Acidimicrobiaceae bacterium]|nr:hypothetical protein [Acidimicrobiaceae bacterium]
MRALRSALRVLGLLTVEVALVAVLYRAGSAMGTVPFDHLNSWLSQPTTETTVTSLIRLGLLIFGWWLLASTVLSLLSHLFGRRDAVVRGRSRRWMFPLVHKIVEGALGLSMLASTVAAGSSVASAAPLHRAAIVRTVGPSRPAAAPTRRERPELGEKRDRDDAVLARSGNTAAVNVPRHLSHPGVLVHKAPALGPATPNDSAPSVANGFAGLPAGTKVHVVATGDCLSVMAEKYLGDWRLDTTIFQMNAGRVQPNGHALSDAHWIYPGWVLVLPDNAVGATVVGGPAAAPSVPASNHVTPPASPTTPAVTAPAPTVATPATAPAPAVRAPARAPAVTAPAAATAPVRPSGVAGAPGVRRPRPLRPLGAPASAPLVSRPPLRSVGEGIAAVASVVAIAAGGVRLSRLLRERSAARLRVLRSQQAAQRKGGRSVLQPTGRLAKLELGVERAAANTAPVSDLLDSALRAMAVGVADWPSDQLPVVVAVHLCDADAAVELQLAVPCPSPPPGFVAPNPYCWRTAVSADELAHLGADAVNPCPCLVTVGASPVGQVLVDLERAGVLSVEGPPALVAGLLNAAAAELACDSPSHHVVVRLVGTAGALDVLPDVEDLELAELPAQLDSHRFATGAEAEDSGGTFELRVRSEGTELYSPMVAVVAGGSLPELANLSECAPPGSGVAVIAAGPVPGTRWRLRLSPSDSRLDRVGLVMDRVSTADAPALSELLAVRANVAGVADVVELRRAVPPSETPAPGEAEQGVMIAAAEGPSEDGEAGTVPPRVLVLCDRPHVENWARPPTVKDGPVEEVVVRLTIADGPVSAEQLYDQIWASRARFREGYRKLVSEGVSRARLCLGRQYIPNASKGMYRIDLPSDLGDFRRLVASADRSMNPAEELALLGQALALVAGTPFKVVTSGSYDSVTIDAGALPSIQRLVGNAAHQAVQLALRLGETERASWAADKGLLVSPVSEQLWQDRALVAEVAEDDEAIDAIHRRAVEATGGLSAETEEWFAQLVGRRRSTRQWRVRGLSGGAPNGNGSAGEEKVGRRG